MGTTSTYGSWISTTLFYASLSGFLSASLWLFASIVPCLPPRILCSTLRWTLPPPPCSCILRSAFPVPLIWQEEAPPRGHGGTSHRPRTRSGFHLVDAIQSSVDSYRSVTPPEIQTEMDLAEADVHVLRRFIPDEEVRETTNPWVLDTGTIRGRTS
jgi:hypothetical protein